MSNAVSNTQLAHILAKHKPFFDQYGIEKIDCLVVGGGDSGDVSELKVTPESVDLKQMVPDEWDTRIQRTLGYHIEGIIFAMVYVLLPGWEINEGSSHEFSIDVSKGTIDVSSTAYSATEYNLLVPHALLKQDSGVEENGSIVVGRLSEVNNDLYRFYVDNHIVEISAQILGIDDKETPGFWQVSPLFDPCVKESGKLFLEKHTRTIPSSPPDDLDLTPLAEYKLSNYPQYDRRGKKVNSGTVIEVNEDLPGALKHDRWNYDHNTQMAVRIEAVLVGPKLLQPLYDWTAERLKEKLESVEGDWPDDVDTSYTYKWVVVNVANDEIRVGACGHLTLSETFETHAEVVKE